MASPSTADALPGGIWAIASELSPEQLPLWMKNAASADGWTFRIPKATSSQAIEMLRSMREVAPWLAVHAEFDWVLAANAQALIAGSRSQSVAVLRQRLTSQNSTAQIKLGAATHDEQELDRAVNAQADFVFYSPIWETPSKRGILAPRGLQALAAVAQRSIPVIALGGIETAQQVAECKLAGAHAVAVLRAAQDPSLLAEMSTAWHG